MKRFASRRAQVVGVVGMLIALLAVGSAALLVFGRNESEPSAADDFEQLLSLLPYNETTVAGTFIFDDAEALKLESLGKNGESFPFHGYTFLAGGYGVLDAQAIGYDPKAIRAEISASDDNNPPAKIYEAVVGVFDPEAIRRATATCDGCGIERETVAYKNTEYYSWGVDLRNNLRIRLAAPVFDELGRSSRLAFTGNHVMRATSSAGIEEMIDAANHERRSLADVPAVRGTVRALAAFHPYEVYATANTICRPLGLAMIEFFAPQPGPGRDRVSKIWDPPGDQPVLRPYLYMAIGINEVKGEPITTVALWNKTPEIARDNARLLKARLETTTNAKGQAWSAVIQKWEVRAEGNVVLARLYGYRDAWLLAKYEPLLFWDGD